MILESYVLNMDEFRSCIFSNETNLYNLMERRVVIIKSVTCIHAHLNIMKINMLIINTFVLCLKKLKFYNSSLKILLLGLISMVTMTLMHLCQANY